MDEGMQLIAGSLEIKRELGAPMPFYAKEDDAGIDIASVEDVTLPPYHRQLISTGLKIALPKNSVGLLWDRSGWASKKGLHVLAGCIDAGYRGEVKVLVLNTSSVFIKIEKFDRIAQLLVIPILRPVIKEVEYFDETDRGDSGFGSSGQ